MKQEDREFRENYDIVTTDDLRPAGNGKDCFYCHNPLGKKHQATCVIRKGAGHYHVAIKNNETNEVRMYRYDMEWDEHSPFQWTENNYSCDCNRHLFFERAIGVDPEEIACGAGKYSISYAKLPSGEMIGLDDTDSSGWVN